MPKTIATTPSWYWPDGVPRVLGIPPVSITEATVIRPAVLGPDRPALLRETGSVGAAELVGMVGTVAAGLAPEGPGSEPGDGREDGPDAVVVCAGSSSGGVLAVLGALASGRPVVLVPPGDVGSAMAGSADGKGGGPGPGPGRPLALGDAEGVVALAGVGIPALDVESLLAGPPPAGAPITDRGTAAGGLRAPSVRLAGRSGPVRHSPRSLLAGALAMATFVAPGPGETWLTTSSPCTWDGLCSALGALWAGATLAVTRPGDAMVEAFERHQPTWTWTSLALAADGWAGGGRKRRRGAGTGRFVLATVDGPFDPDECRGVGSGAGAEVLTVFGMAETGPMLAAHPSWHIDESVGIPVSNMHVVPADPDTGEPVDAMWELLDRAMLSVWSPSLAVDGFDPGPGRPAGRRFVTGVLAASDPNGMLYLVDE